jgi:NAD(P)-dependent dehydrogenase (short-subunit alcohol dehydrogenase family)
MSHTTGSNRFSGKVAAITGASMGIGRATALKLAREGAYILALDIDPNLEAVVEEIKAFGGQAEHHHLDCSDRKAVTETFAGLIKDKGGIDILVNVVGKTARPRQSEFWCSEPEVWDYVIDMSLMTTLNCTRQVVPGMRERQQGKIVNIASAAFLVPTPTFSDYAAAKAGVIGFTRVLAIELAPFNVNVNAVSPGPIATPATTQHTPEFREKIIATIPLRRYGEPEDIANGVAYLASEDAKFVTGHNLVISGGRAIG